MMCRLLLFLLFCSVLRATDYKTGIDLTFSGSSGTDYAVEQFYADPTVCDKKVVYIKAVTSITFTHNARNVAYLGSGYAIVGTANNGYVMRYKVDRDWHWGLEQFANAGANNWPAYSAPLTFATLANFPNGDPVVGSTGAVPAITLNTTTAQDGTYYWRGILDAYGDQIHLLTVADDDTAISGISGNAEFQASDGAVHVFIVNPRHPALVITVTGDAQFYTTPIKAYDVPQARAQTTYFNAGTGTISFSLKDLYGTNVVYRINGGSWSSASSNPVLYASDFSTGSNTLDYYDVGNGSTSDYKTRTVVKNPTHPSLAESHGTNYLLPGSSWPAVKAQIANSATAAYGWYTTFDGSDFFNQRASWEANCLQGKRYDYSNGAQYGNAGMSAVGALINGWDATATGTTHSYGWFAKTALLDNATQIDPVGLEQNQAGTSLGSREDIYRGYYDVNPLTDMAFTYDLVAAYYRSDQNANGITAIEDIYIRDCIAGSIFQQIFNNNFAAPGVYASTGMWDTARSLYALGAMWVIPTYSSAAYGTCGLDGNTTVYPYCPFSGTNYTWKAILVDQTPTLTSFPQLYRGMGLENALILSNGNFNDRQSYFGFPVMGHAVLFGVTTAKIHAPAMSWACTNQALYNCAIGTFYGTDAGEGYLQFNQPTSYNSLYPSSGKIGNAWAQSLGGGDNERNGHIMLYSQAFGLTWYDWFYLPGNASLSGSLTIGGNASIK